MHGAVHGGFVALGVLVSHAKVGGVGMCCRIARMVTLQGVTSRTVATIYHISLFCIFSNLVEPQARIVHSRAVRATSSVIDVVDSFKRPRIHVVAYVCITIREFVASVGILVLQVVPSTLVAIFPVKRGNVTCVFSVGKIAWLGC
jgi:hypothetical protein